MLRLAIFLCSFSAFIAPAAAQDTARVVTPGFSAAVDRQGWIRVWYRGIPIVTGTNFSVAKPGWKGQLFPNWRRGAVYRVRRGRRGETRVLSLVGKSDDAVTNRVTVEVEPNRVRIENRYRIARRPDTGYEYTDCFFNKKLLDGASYRDDAGHTGALRAASGQGVPNNNLRRVTITTRFGELTIAVAHEHTVGGKKSSVGWQFRNVCDRKWGPEDRRSFSLMNLFEIKKPAAIVGRSEYVFTFKPSPQLAVELQRRREQQERERAALMAKREAMLAARRERIEANHGILLMPKPQQMQPLDGEFVITSQTKIVVGDRATKVDRRGAERLAEELRDYYRLRVPIVTASSAAAGESLIVIGRPEINPLSKALLARWKERVTPDSPGPEGYVLIARPDMVLVAGSDVRGAWYGVQALVQMLQWRGRRVVVPCVRIRDWPRFRTRAMVLTLGARKQMPFLLMTLRRALPRARINMVFIGGASLGRVRWPSHPEIAYPNAFTADDIHRLADCARENFIEPVPHVQGFGHTGKTKAVHPELLAPVPGRQPCFDITNPAARKFVFELYADAIAAFRPKRYFHVGFDEAQGIKAICKGRAPADVVAEHINAVSRWLEQRGLRMVMWTDMLLDYETFKDNSAAHSRHPYYGNVDTAPAIDRIPKSIVMANWYYRDAEEHPALAYFKKRGFEVFPTTWFRPKNNFNFVRSAHRLGLDWVSGSSWMYCSAMNPGMMSLLVGEYGWTPETPKLDELSYDPTELLATWLKSPRPSDVPCEQTPIDITAAMNRSYADDAAGDDCGWVDLGSDHDLSALAPGRHRMGRYAFQIAAAAPGAGCVLVKGPGNALRGVPTKATIRVGRRCDSLVFLHTINYFDFGPRKVGVYRIRYADGQEIAVGLRNAINIGPWRRVRYTRHFGAARVSGYYVETERAWVGYTRAGEEVDLVAYEWVNPRPEVAVSDVRIELTDRRPELVLGLFAVTAVSRR